MIFYYLMMHQSKSIHIYQRTQNSDDTPKNIFNLIIFFNSTKRYLYANFLDFHMFNQKIGYILPV